MTIAHEMKKILFLIFLSFIVTQTTSAAEPPEMTSGYCEDTLKGECNTMGTMSCSGNQEVVGRCTGLFGTFNWGACCKMKENGPVDPNSKEVDISSPTIPIQGKSLCEAAKPNGWGGECKVSSDPTALTDACNDSGNDAEDFVGFCEPPGMIERPTHCCVARGTGHTSPTRKHYQSIGMTEATCRNTFSANGSGYGGKCEDIDSTLISEILDGKEPTCDTTGDVIIGLCRASFSGDFDNACCVPKEGEYCAKLKESEGVDICAGGAGGEATGIEYGDYQLLEQIPGSLNTSGKLQPYLESIYKAGFVLIVIGAIFMIGLGGFTYMASAGNTSMIKKGKGMITDAIIGLVVALCIWLILNIINPDLVNLSIEPLKEISFTTTSESLENADTDTSSENPSQQSGKKATNCPSPLIQLPGDLSLKGGTNMICPQLATQLQRLKSVSGWRITRLTGGGAQSQCHKVGTSTTGSCADVALNPNPGFNNPKWDDLCEAAAKLSGVRILNEASNTARCQKALGPFKKTKNQTGAHLHIDYNGN